MATARVPDEFFDADAWTTPAVSVICFRILHHDPLSWGRDSSEPVGVLACLFQKPLRHAGQGGQDLIVGMEAADDLSDDDECGLIGVNACQAFRNSCSRATNQSDSSNCCGPAVVK